MSEPADDCWNRLGVRGDRSCEKLREHIHCRNCDVYATAAGAVMQRPVPEEYRRKWAEHFASPEPAPPHTDRTALVFRIGHEWLSLPARLTVTIAEITAPHRLPHRDRTLLSGIVNVKGTLYPCMSLAGLLNIASEQPPQPQGRRIYPRLLVMQLHRQALALPVDDLYGIHRYASADLQSPPAGSERSLDRYVTGILRIDALHVGCLDEELVGYKLADALK